MLTWVLFLHKLLGLNLLQGLTSAASMPSPVEESYNDTATSPGGLESCTNSVGTQETLNKYLLILMQPANLSSVCSLWSRASLTVVLKCSFASSSSDTRTAQKITKFSFFTTATYFLTYVFSKLSYFYPPTRKHTCFQGYFQDGILLIINLSYIITSRW